MMTKEIRKSSRAGDRRVRLVAFTCGELTGDLGGFLAGVEGRLRVPVPSYLIEHPRGRIVFDSGLHPEAALDPAGRLGRLARLFDVHFGPGQDLAARLLRLGIDPSEIRFLVNSHLHFDHSGGNALLPRATLVVQRREWEAGHDPDLAAKNSFDPRDYDSGHDLLLVDGEHDLFGDGSVTCVPTYGHTPGHQSLRVRLEGGEVLLAADACYLRRTLDELHLPPYAHDFDAMREALGRMRALERSGVRVFPGHDPEFWRGVAQAPAEVRL